MKLPKLEGFLLASHAGFSIRASEAERELTKPESTEVIRRVELHDELVEALEWAMQYGDWAEACDGNPIMKIAYDRAQAVLNKSQGA